jgi:hypothetical protein
MFKDVNVGPTTGIKLPATIRKPGRPRAIPRELESVILELYRLGYGYRAIARILRTDYRLNPDFSTVKRPLKNRGALPRPGSPSK